MKRSQAMIDRRIKAAEDLGVPAFLAGATEHAFDLTVCEYADFRGWKLTYHTHDSRKSEAGFPDRVFLHEAWGRIIFLELKDMIRLMTPDQVHWMTGLVRARQECAVIRPCDWEEIERFLSSPSERLTSPAYKCAWPNVRELDLLQRRKRNARKHHAPNAV